MQVREQRVGADMGKQAINDGHRRHEYRSEAQDHTASFSEEGVETDEWAPFIAEGGSNPGLFLQHPVLQRLTTLKKERPDTWVNLRARIKRGCPDLPIRELDKAVRRQIKWANRVGLVAEALALSD